MKRLTILPPGKSIEVKPGTMLLDAIRQAGIEIPAPCNGRQLCGKCKLRVENADPPPDEPNEHLTADESAAGMRLACQTAVHADMQVALIQAWSLDTRILEGERLHLSRNAPAAVVGENRGRYRLHYADRPPALLEHWQPSFAAKGMAIDLGTTTLVATLMDLETGTELATASAVNPQTRFGHDVMTRIAKASDADGLAELSGLVADALNALVDACCRASRSRPDEIVDAVLAGNTTMLQIAAAIDPAALGVTPFTMGIQSGCTYPAGTFRLKLNPRARIYIPPAVHAFVGADVSAGLLSTDFFSQTAPTLFIDMGTNGEMALAANGQWLVTSTAAGPAFEGMGISHGMRASAGAIETVWSNGNFLSLRTIDDTPAAGICGSGIMDLMAGLVRTGAVDPSGRLMDPQKDATPDNPFSDRYMLWDGVAAIQLEKNIYFTQKDVRQFQLAKSAVRTGVDLLLAAAGVPPEQLALIIVAGAFGYHLKADTLRRIGILPKAFNGGVVFAGNTCRTGCALMLVDAGTRNLLQKSMRQVSHLAIAEAADFQARFISNMAL